MRIVACLEWLSAGDGYENSSLSGMVEEVLEMVMRIVACLEWLRKCWRWL